MLWDEVKQGLGRWPLSLPPVLFYDAEGSRLFDEITRTPEYYPTRTELAILREHADEILALANGTGRLSIVELGAGSGEKTRTLLSALVARQGGAEYVPIDVSADAVQGAAAAIERAMPGVRVRPVVGRNREVLRDLDRAKEPPHLVLFIGSSIGNFETPDAIRFLGDVASTLRPQDRLLLGVDLVKDAAVLERAYNDAQGVTAAFNKNVLARLNREAGADFDLDAWRHRAFYDVDKRRIEMHLVSGRDQRVRIPKLDLVLDVARGETIHTENSYKYRAEDVAALSRAAGLEQEAMWKDARAWFCLHLFRARSGAPPQGP